MNDKSAPAWGKKASFLWIISTVTLSALFILASAPLSQAQGREQKDDRRYTTLIQNVFDFIQNHYVDVVDPQKLYEGAMQGMFNSLGDPYSVFLKESEMTDMSENVIQGTYGGVGLYISKLVSPPEGTPAYVEVASPIEDTPGWRAGLKPGDLILQVNGEATDTLTLDETVSRLKGPPGEKVELLIRRGKGLEFPVTIVREVIEVPTVKYAMIGNDIGYLKLISFSSMTLDRTREALEYLKKEGSRSIILDLRNNYGGLLMSAVGISDLFLDGGLVVTVKSRIPSENGVFNARNSTMLGTNVPVVVLINKGSASASEIVAGALKDRGRAYLVGEKSYGKGSVQQVYPLDKSGFKITTARYYTPSDVNIDKIGIPPDREVLFPEFTPEDVEHLNALIKSNSIPKFVEDNPQADKAAVESFVKKLRTEYQLDESLLRRLVRDEQNRTAMAPVYDMEYDVQLQEAVKILRSGNYPQLMKTTKTLKVLQDEAEKDDSAQAS